MTFSPSTELAAAGIRQEEAASMKKAASKAVWRAVGAGSPW